MQVLLTGFGLMAVEER